MSSDDVAVLLRGLRGGPMEPEEVIDALGIETDAHGFPTRTEAPRLRAARQFVVTNGLATVHDGTLTITRAGKREGRA